LRKHEEEEKMFGLGLPEMIVVLVIGIVVFGPSKLPSLGKSLGEAIRGFKKEISEEPADDKAKIEK
jgi:sec-independent protein translocase protein TatA